MARQDQIDGAEGAGDAGKFDAALDGDDFEAAAVFDFELLQRIERRIDHGVEMLLRQFAIEKDIADHVWTAIDTQIMCSASSLRMPIRLAMTSCMAEPSSA